MWTQEMAKPELNWIRLEGLSFNGLRSSAATKLKELGCPDAESQAITEMSKPMIEQYTKPLDQRATAQRAMIK
jgi:hypothetical protein